MRIRCLACRQRVMPRFEFEHDKRECPQCGAASPFLVVVLTDVHFLVAHAHGQFPGAFGRFNIACQPKRDRLGTQTLRMDTGEWDDFSASHDPSAVTCLSCMTTSEFQKMAKAIPWLAANVEARRGISIVSGVGCCGG